MSDNPPSPPEELQTKKPRIEEPTAVKKQLHAAVKVAPGTIGDRVTIYANSFEISFDAEKIFQHRVDFEPEILSKGTRRAMIRLLGENYPEVGKGIIFDGFYTLFSKKVIDNSFQLTTKNQNKYTLNVRKTNTLADPKDKENYYSEEETRKFLNIVLKNLLVKQGLKEFKRNYYDERGKKDLRSYELWPGFKTTINIVDKGRLVLNADLCWRVMHTNTVYDVLRRMDPRDFKSIESNQILCKYNDRSYIVDAVATDINPRSTFERTHKGETTKVSFARYFEERYNIKIRDLDQPLLLSYQTKRTNEGKKQEIVYLIPELSYFTGITNDIPKRDLISHTRVNPPERFEDLEKFAYKLNSGAKSSDNEWKLSVKERMIEVQGRLLPLQKICFGRGQSEVSERASWQLQNREFVTPVRRIDRWLVVSTDRDRRTADGLVQQLTQDSKAFGFEFGTPKFAEARGGRSEAFVNAIAENVVSKDSFHFVVIVLPNNNPSTYSAIKQQVLIRTPVPSQCVIAKTLDGNKRRSVCTKLAQQMQAKIGATLWTIDFSGPITQKPTMVVGIDTSTAKKALRGKSVAAFCATMNSRFSEYYSKVDFIPREQEISSGLAKSLREAIDDFLKKNNTPPMRVVVFRDGVGDGQHQAVLDNEIPQFQNVFKEISQKYNRPYDPALCFVLVKKRINTRLFAKGGQMQNPRFGTVVDTTITSKNQFDFFLITQNVGNMGSVSPTRYHVLYNRSDLGADDIQMLAYKLSYLYYNWNGTIAIPAPVQYAHKLSLLTSTSVHQSPSQSLSQNLFYL